MKERDDMVRVYAKTNLGRVCGSPAGIDNILTRGSTIENSDLL